MKASLMCLIVVLGIDFPLQFPRKRLVYFPDTPVNPRRLPDSFRLGYFITRWIPPRWEPILSGGDSSRVDDVALALAG